MGKRWKIVGQIGVGLVAGLSLAHIAGCDYGPLPGSVDAGRDLGRDAGFVEPPPIVMDAGPEMSVDAGRPEETDAGTAIGFESVAPNVLLLLDRSGSMAQPSQCGEATCPSKWEQILALGGYLEEVKRGARLGAAFFPSTTRDGCYVATVPDVPLSDAPDIDEQIMSAAYRTRPGGSTPLAAALDQMRLNGGLDDRTRDNNLIILTDGHPNCACAGSDAECERAAAVAAVAALATADPPVDVYVIGFGASARAAQETLGEMARAAGHEDYYQADTVEQLIGRLYEVAIENVSCTFGLDEWPAPEDLIVWMDDVEVPACTTEPCDAGYSYDPDIGEVVLLGTTCAALRDGMPHNVWFDRRP